MYFPIWVSVTGDMYVAVFIYDDGIHGEYGHKMAVQWSACLKGTIITINIFFLHKKEIFSHTSHA